jgi:hypothetical protein
VTQNGADVELPARVSVVEPVEVAQPVRVTGTVAVEGPVTISEPVKVEQSEPWQVRGEVTLAQDDVTATPVAAPRSVVWSVASSIANVELLGVSPTRIGATITNDSTANLYVKFGNVATSSDYTVMLYPSQYYELPFRYTGEVAGIWTAANGSARLTEVR